MTDVTRILSAIEQGNPDAAEQLLPLFYEELRKLAARRLAHEKPGQTLQATALVHEAHLRLVDLDKVQQWNSRGHIFAAGAKSPTQLKSSLQWSESRLPPSQTATAGARRSSSASICSRNVQLRDVMIESFHKRCRSADAQRRFAKPSYDGNSAIAAGAQTERRAGRLTRGVRTRE